MMATQSKGVQKLLEAEKIAKGKIEEARKRKQRRLKQAKEEAQAEVEAYRLERDKQYKEMEQKVLGSRGDLEKRIEHETQQKIQEQQMRLQHHQEQALQMLLHSICDIRPQLHTNFRQ